MKRFFLFDVETGGLEEKEVSFLTLYGMVLDERLEKLNVIDLKIRPPHGRYVVDIDALKINKIDLLKHDAEAIPELEAGQKLRDFLFLNCPTNSKLIPSGHNINLDVRFAQKLVPDWKAFCGHRWLDTSVLGQTLQLLGKIPNDNNGSLAKLCLHYGIDPSGNHDAKVDVELTYALLKAMIKDLGGMKPAVP
jgi:DNA polymerase III alpha subunit (gram-positive type)